MLASASYDRTVQLVRFEKGYSLRSQEGGRLIWYIDGTPVAKGWKPQGTRRFEEWRIILNVTVGGNVCNGQIPTDGCYDLVIHEMGMYKEPPCRWQKFKSNWVHTKEGALNARLSGSA